ncbi:MAG: DUF4405 domain-containing protein [Anaerolineae bacterium]|nr:DUF4405 domain-containing protein [Anaerolineae bacterium]
MNKRGLSLQTKTNWLIDALLFTSALIATISGIYFLFLPSGGYRGGRNPYYGITILFDRHTWNDLHTWFGLGMIVIVAIHLTVHSRWIVTMTKHAFRAVTVPTCRLSRGAWTNIAIDATIALGFLLTAISGLYFFFEPAQRPFLFDAITWDLIHTWAGVAMVGAALLHLTIHWRWIVNVTKRMKDEIVSMKTKEQSPSVLHTSSF